MAKKILFISQEISPYVEGTPMAELGAMVPTKTQSSRDETRIFMPKWGTVNERRGQLHEVIRLSGANITINDVDHPLLIKVASMTKTRMQVYFIDNEEFFARKFLTTDAEGKEFADNGERAIFYVRGVIDTVLKLRWNPDIIFCQGWMASLAAVYIRNVFASEPAFENAKIIISLFPKDPAKQLDKSFRTGLPYSTLTQEKVDAYGTRFTASTIAKMCIDNADAVVEALPGVKPELLEYAAKQSKAVLPYSDGDISESYNNFIASLLENK